MKDFVNAVLDDPTPDETNIMLSPDGSIVRTGHFSSGNFVKGRQGWDIDAEGNAEFNKGTFRGTFTIGGTVITIGPTDDIQTSIDNISLAGGGTLYLQAGTYNVTGHIIVPSNVSIIGAGLASIIDFGGGAYQIQIVGSSPYSTGTVAIANDATGVVGTGTTFTAAMIDQSILLEDFWYIVSAVADATHLSLDRAYMGTTLTASSFVIATTVDTVNLNSFLVQNSSVALIKFQYVNGFNIDGVLPVSGLVGIDGDDSSFFNILNAGADLCTTAMTFDNVQFGTYFNNNQTQCGVGITWSKCRNWCIDVFAFVNITAGNAMTFTDCSNNDVLDFSIQQITGKGIEFVSGCYDMGITAGVIKYCSSDGIKLTATTDYVTMGSSLEIHDNSGWGINIAASTCDNNVILGNQFYTNTSGPVTDSGTGTIIDANSPASVNVKAFSHARATAQVAANTNILTATVGPTDTTFQLLANVLVTTATAHSFSVTVDYTDESNTARTLTIPFAQLAGTLITAITNVTGASAYEGVPLVIRAKASTSIVFKTAGTFTTVAYNVDCSLLQIY